MVYNWRRCFHCISGREGGDGWSGIFVFSCSRCFLSPFCSLCSFLSRLLHMAFASTSTPFPLPTYTHTHLHTHPPITVGYTAHHRYLDTAFMTLSTSNAMAITASLFSMFLEVRVRGYGLWVVSDGLCCEVSTRVDYMLRVCL